MELIGVSINIYKNIKMKKLIIIIALFLSYNTYAQYVPKAGNKLNVKPNGILVPTSTTDDTPIARLELFATGVSTITPSALPIATGSLLGAVKVGSGLAIDGAGVLSATGGGGSVPIGTDGQVLGYSSGTPTAVTLGLSQLSDISSIPAFSNGVYVFTGINPTTGAALRSFIEFSTTTPKAGTFPTYGTGGVLPVANGVASGDAVNVSQLSGYVPTTRTVTAGNGLSGGGALSGNINLSADTTGVLATKANTLSLSQIQTRFGSGLFYPQPAVFVGSGENTSNYFNIIGATGVSGTGAVLMGTSPTMVTPTLGVATATSINKVTITAPTTNATLTLAQGSTLATAGAFSNTITTTANTTVTFPTTGTLYGTATGSITSAQLLASLSNETGTGVAVFGTSPTIATPNITWAISTKTGAYTVTSADYTLLGNATTASFTITLPAASTVSGKVFNFKKIDSSANTVTVSSASNIDGSASKILSTQYSGFTVQSDGTVYHVIF